MNRDVRVVSPASRALVRSRVRPGAIGVTGTPGTGKKSVSPRLARILKRDFIDINSLARARWSPDEQGEIAVDLKVLRMDLERSSQHAVVSGHLLSDLVRPSRVEFVAVLRCEPAVLRLRLASRGYPPEKVTENVEAELIGVVLDAAVRRFGPARVHEYDATHTKAAALATRIAREYRSGVGQSEPWIDWTLGYDSSTKLRSLLSNPSTEPAST
jgi:adenylate kinase